MLEWKSNMSEKHQIEEGSCKSLSPIPCVTIVGLLYTAKILLFVFNFHLGKTVLHKAKLVESMCLKRG